MKTPVLLPYPKSLEKTGGTFSFNNGDCVLIPFNDKDMLYTTVIRLKDLVHGQLKIELPLLVGKMGMLSASVVFERDDEIAEEEYRLEILPGIVRIYYGSGAGAFHAVSTLKQLIVQYGKEIPCVVIKDIPDFRARGIMLDVSRDKIPCMKTLYRLIDLMADLKLNQLQLYTEGFSFAYATYPFVYQDGTPVTGEEIVELDRYCRQRYIQLVPNQNSFGHMGKWLARSEFRDLAIAPDGYEGNWLPGVKLGPETLNPLDPNSIELVDQMTSDLLPYFSSDYFNVGCDETDDLVCGKGKEICEESGSGRVYLDFLLKIYALMKKYGKRMMFWGDIIIKHPELISEIPKDVVALEWGYEANHPFAEHCEKFRDSGLEYYVCPGTSTWASITGRTDNMLANILNAAENGRKYGAAGLLNTDWGDLGHWQYQLFSYPGFAYGAALSWGVDQNRNIDIPEFLNIFIFRDRNNQIGQLIMDLGNYYPLEKVHKDNVSIIFWTMFVAFEDTSITDGFAVEDYEAIKEYVLSVQKRLSHVWMQCEDADIIEAEIRNAVLFIVHGCNLGILKLHVKNKDVSTATKALAEHMIEEMTILIRQHENLWLSGNRHGGLNSSVSKLEKLKKEYAKI